MGPLNRLLLVRSAARYTAAGWPVAPAAWWDRGRYRCGAKPCPTAGHHLAGHHLAGDGSVGGPPSAGAGILAVPPWPYTLALLTGVAFDALEVPAVAGAAVMDRLRADGFGGPVARLPTGRWILAVRPEADVVDELLATAATVGVVRHGPGSYVPAPPSRLQHGRVTWIVPPWSVGWRLPAAAPVLAAALRRPAALPLSG